MSSPDLNHTTSKPTCACDGRTCWFRRGGCCCWCDSGSGSSLTDGFASAIEFACHSVEEPCTVPNGTPARHIRYLFEPHSNWICRIEDCLGLGALLDCSQDGIRTARLIEILNHVLTCSVHKTGRASIVTHDDKRDGQSSANWAMEVMLQIF